MQFSEDQIAEIQDKFMNLPETKKELLRKFFRDSEEARILRVLIGPQFMDLVNMTRAPKRGLAAPRP
jgi:hypothetical protein